MTRAPFLSIAFFVVLGVASPPAVQAQEALDDVAFFHNINQDARLTSAPWLEGHLFRRSYDGRTLTFMGAHFGLPLASRFEGGLGMFYSKSSIDFGPSISGISDLYVHGRYTFGQDLTRLALGAFTSVPIGSEDVGEGDVDAGVFVAVRRALSERTVLAGKVSLDHYDIAEDDSEPSLRFHAGVIHQARDRLAVLGEFLAQTLADTAEISGGVDYTLSAASHLRGSIGVGLNDNTSDVSFSIAYLHNFGASGGS